MDHDFDGALHDEKPVIDNGPNGWYNGIGVGNTMSDKTRPALELLRALVSLPDLEAVMLLYGQPNTLV